jgi:hypothetical protein
MDWLAVRVIRFCLNTNTSECYNPLSNLKFTKRFFLMIGKIKVSRTRLM